MESMAKKSKRLRKKVPSRNKRGATKKTSKSPARAPSKKSQAGRKGTAKKVGGRAHSVDSLLQHFAKERAQKETQLQTLQQKKRELEERTRKLHEQTAKLAEQQRAVEGELSQLDQTRDQQVQQLLAKLGVRLEGSGIQAEHARDNDRQPSASDRGGQARDRIVKINGRD